MADETTIKPHLVARSTWLRGVFMLLFAVLYQVVELIVLAVAVFQFLVVLFTGERNRQLLEFAKSLSRFVYDLMRFFMFETEDKPFPFAPWPAAGSSTELKSSPGA